MTHDSRSTRSVFGSGDGEVLDARYADEVDEEEEAVDDTEKLNVTR